MIICAIVGFAVVDSLTSQAQTTSTTNQTIGTANASGYLSGTLTYTPLSTPTVYANGVRQTANFTVATGSKTIVTTNPAANFINASVKTYYDYDGDTYLSGSLSRTIITYIVPIGLIAVLGMVAGLGV